MKSTPNTVPVPARRVCTLTVLLCVCPLCCQASWMLLGADGPEHRWSRDGGCRSLPLSARQREVCRKRSFLAPSIVDAARLALGECQNQFRHERWNCSVGRDPALFGQQLSSGTKETAFVYAVMAAGLVHAVTRFCSRGNVSECGCDARLQGPAEAWHWGGCSDHVQYGTWFSRRFLAHAAVNASAGTRAHALLRMSQHNSEAGRQAVVTTMSTDCRCHGVSGSCAVKTCWRTMAPFGRVGAYLKERYEGGVRLKRKEPRAPDKHRLVFVSKSPNYCLEDRRGGVLGTRGRRCNRTSGGPDGCKLLCCGRGYDTRVERHVRRCACKFVWCCYVRCRRCESMSDAHACK
ncbi:protein Wnt-16 isoform X2 [Hippocampus zosterae]|uniref:protein Wnt-16 isoform X2 n=1 Tax=Hippocampus zosterae TaxID=109293 RepID=UPI00223E7328|nr:protein Wnt-16 isoform X2 [Hippocampus zosterae]